MLNAQVAYLEAITGPAMHVYAGGGVQIRDYRVAGCRVTVYANGPAVVGYSLDLTPRCNFDLGAFLGNGYSSTSGLTIGKFAAGLFGPQLLVQSSCIYLCGNAADPTVDFTFEGPHAVGPSAPEGGRPAGRRCLEGAHRFSPWAASTPAARSRSASLTASSARARTRSIRTCRYDRSASSRPTASPWPVA